MPHSSDLRIPFGGKALFQQVSGRNKFENGLKSSQGEWPSWRQGFHRAGRGWWGNSGWYLCLCVFVYSCSCIVVYFCICICIFTNSVWRQDSLPVGRGRWGNPGWGWLCEPSSPERGFVKKWQFCVITTVNAERLMMTTMTMMMTLTIASSRVRLVFCRRNASVIVEDRDLPEKSWKPSNC